jgi:hypothetical protein
MSDGIVDNSRRRDNIIRPLPFRLYKGVSGSWGVVRFSLKKADLRNKREGCVFLEMAPAVGPNNYDWQNSKVIMSLSITDIPKIVFFLRNPSHQIFGDKDDSNNIGVLKLFHDKNAGTPDRGTETKTLVISKPKNKDSFYFNVTESIKGRSENLKITVPVAPFEALAIGTLLQEAIPQILGWTGKGLERVNVEAKKVN